MAKHWIAKDKNGKVHLFSGCPVFNSITGSWYIDNFIESNRKLILYKKNWKDYGCENLKYTDPPMKIDFSIKNEKEVRSLLKIVEKYYGKLPLKEDIIEEYKKI